ncbi:MAG: Tad domain-containing protein [Syntrophobacterales bacterium]|nr:Tad domain-containing protein [Syntrophobacterales bacterium]
MIRKSNVIRDNQGVAAVTIAISLMVLIGMASLAIDLGQLYTARNELQNVADAAALAGVGQLVQDSGGTAVRDSSLATQTAIEVAQTQSQLQGLPALAAEARNDVTLAFGVWDIYAADRSLAWTGLGATCDSDSNANALRVTIKRAPGLAYGPVTNFFAKAIGFNTSEVGATATAFLGFTAAAGTGTVTVPLAVPQSVLAGLRGERDSWFASLFAPKEAHATVKSLTFKDLGSTSWYQSNLSKPLFDSTKAYLFVVNKSDSVPTTVVNNLKKYYTSGGSPVRAMARGTQLYPLSEYQWASNIKTIFLSFKSAYDRKKDANGKWRVSVPVYSPTSPLAQRRWTFPWYLVKNLLPGVTEANACFTFWTQTYPGGNVPVYVDGFTNVDITGVTYKSDCVTTGLPDQVNNPNSCRNTCSVTVDVPTDQSTVSPPGSTSGGPDNGHITPGGTTNVGAIAAIPRLVQ